MSKNTEKSTKVQPPFIAIKLHFEMRSKDIYISVLKTDVEGADTMVLMGARQLLLERRIGHVYFEENSARMKLLGILSAETFEFLAGIGYSAVQLGSPTEYVAVPR